MRVPANGDHPDPAAAFDLKQKLLSRAPTAAAQRLLTVGTKSLALIPCRISVIQAKAVAGVECQLVKVLPTLRPSMWRGCGVLSRLLQMFVVGSTCPTALVCTLSLDKDTFHSASMYANQSLQKLRGSPATRSGVAGGRWFVRRPAGFRHHVNNSAAATKHRQYDSFIEGHRHHHAAGRYAARLRVSRGQARRAVLLRRSWAQSVDSQRAVVVDPDHRFALEVAARLGDESTCCGHPVALSQLSTLGACPYARHGPIAIVGPQQHRRRGDELAVAQEDREHGGLFVDDSERQASVVCRGNHLSSQRQRSDRWHVG